MLTFTNAPKTLFGPCEHALWNGKAFYSKHHMHMVGTVDDWKAGVAEIVKNPIVIDAVNEYIDLNKKLAAAKTGMSRDDSETWTRLVGVFHAHGMK